MKDKLYIGHDNDYTYFADATGTVQGGFYDDQVSADGFERVLALLGGVGIQLFDLGDVSEVIQGAYLKVHPGDTNCDGLDSDSEWLQDALRADPGLLQAAPCRGVAQAAG